MNSQEMTKLVNEIVNKLSENKPKWFDDHERDDQEQFKAIRQSLDELKEYHQKSLPMFEWFQEITLTKKIRIDLLRATGLWSGIIIGLASVGGILWAIIRFIIHQAK